MRTGVSFAFMDFLFYLPKRHTKLSQDKSLLSLKEVLDFLRLCIIFDAKPHCSSADDQILSRFYVLSSPADDGKEHQDI